MLQTAGCLLLMACLHYAGVTLSLMALILRTDRRGLHAALYEGLGAVIRPHPDQSLLHLSGEGCATGPATLDSSLLSFLVRVPQLQTTIHAYSA